MVYYTVYKTTNLINGKYYIGAHKTTNLNDGYLGSGKLIKEAIDQFGVDNFKKEILHILTSSRAMYSMEKTLVNESVVNDSNSYNMKTGGKGGWVQPTPQERKRRNTVRSLKRISKKYKKIKRIIRKRRR